MVDTVPEYVDESEVLHSEEPWIWLFTVRFDEIRKALRIAKNPTHITWPTSGGHVYYGRSLDFDGIEANTKSSSRKTSITFTGMDTTVREYLTTYRNFIDRTVIIRQVHSGHLDLETPRMEIPFRVANVHRSIAGIIWELGMPRKWDQQEPHRFYDPSRCAWTCGDSRCGANLDLPGSPSFCDYTLDGANGCKRFEEFEKENGYPVIHTGRYGGFPSAPKSRE
jgi:hypothetical protein